MKSTVASISAKMTDALPKVVLQTAKSLIAAISDPVLICAKNGTIIAINPAMQRFLRQNSEKQDTDVTGVSLFDVFPSNAEQLNKTLALCRSQSGILPGTLKLPDQNSNSDHERTALQASMLQLDRPSPSHILIRFLAQNSVSKHRFEALNSTLRKKNKQLLLQRELARKDAHTGVWQRATLFEELPHYLKSVKNDGVVTSFVVIDLDNFKDINDRHGHPCGDLVLATVAKMLLEACRNKDRVARIGGEEFAMVLPHTNSDEARRACQRVRRAIMETEIPYDDQVISITASFGVTEIVEGDTGEDVYKRADYALYCAKRSGRNKVICVSASSSLDDSTLIDAQD
jgi:diguanylate cyclase (GGDEF)-like protein